MINFTFSALLGPVFGATLVRAVEGSNTMSLAQFQVSFQRLLVGTFLALILTFLLKETGTAVREPRENG